MEAKCKYCVYFKKPRWHDESRGICRRYPPTLSITEDSDDRESPAAIGSTFVFPTTEEDEWCGEYKKKE